MSINLNLNQISYKNNLDSNSLKDLQYKFKLISKDIDSIKDIENLSLSQEAFLSNILIGLSDIVTGVFSNALKSINFLSKLKISELVAYERNNKLRLKFIFKLQYTDIAMVNIKVVPFRFNYNDLLSYLDKNYRALNIENTYQKISDNFKEISTLLINGFYKDFDKSIKNLMISFDKKTTKEILDQVTNNFFLTDIRTIEFGKLFNSMKEFKNNYQTLMDNADRYSYIGKVGASMVSIDKSIKKIIDLLDKNKDIKKKKELAISLKRFSEVIFDIANYYEAYAILMKIQVRLEHHMVETLSVLKAFSKNR